MKRKAIAAERIEFILCRKCGCIHLHMLDADDEVIAGGDMAFEEWAVLSAQFKEGVEAGIMPGEGDTIQ